MESASAVINAADPPNRKKFTIAHELGHWVMHRSLLRDRPEIGVLLREPLGRADSSPLEQEANAFAANLLVPDNMLKSYRTDDIVLLAKVFGVSEEVIGYRLKRSRLQVA